MSPTTIPSTCRIQYITSKNSSYEKKNGESDYPGIRESTLISQSVKLFISTLSGHSDSLISIRDHADKSAFNLPSLLFPFCDFIANTKYLTKNKPIIHNFKCKMVIKSSKRHYKVTFFNKEFFRQRWQTDGTSMSLMLEAHGQL